MAIRYVLFAALLVAGLSTAGSARATAGAPVEIVRRHIDINVNRNGSYAEADEIAYRALDAQGVQLLQQKNLSYTEGYQSIKVISAYTLKADGRRVPVGTGGILRGAGETSAPGFSDERTLSIVFPDVAVGDQVVLVTVFRQLRPWITDNFATRLTFDPHFVTHDVRVSLTAPAHGFPLVIDARGMAGGERETAGGQRSWVWTLDNPVAQKREPDTIANPQAMPHVTVSSFADYAAIATDYGKRFEDKARVTKSIRTLADRVTRGVAGKRAQARALYDWVSAHISYVNIVLGAGGLTPHTAGQVLEHGYGDCKDHVVLLQALLAAKGIDSSPALIDATGGYTIPRVAVLSAFDHVITYIPRFKLFADSTARYAPFGTLPAMDAGKPVVTIVQGEVIRTPAIRPADNTIRADQTIHIHPDGSADGETTVRATGAAAVDMRGLVDSVPADNQDEYFRRMLGPGAAGTLSSGDPGKLGKSFRLHARYTVADYANLPGPGALRAALGFKPFSLTSLLVGSFPARRTQPYLCQSVTATVRATVTLAPAMQVMAMPKDNSWKTATVSLSSRYEKLPGHRIRVTTRLVTDYPREPCSAESYNAAHAKLSRMVHALSSQILYQPGTTD